MPPGMGALRRATGSRGGRESCRDPPEAALSCCGGCDWHCLHAVPTKITGHPGPGWQLAQFFSFGVRLVPPPGETWGQAAFPQASDLTAIKQEELKYIKIAQIWARQSGFCFPGTCKAINSLVWQSPKSSPRRCWWCLCLKNLGRHREKKIFF